MPVNLLYIIQNREFGGGERGFAQLINALPQAEYRIHVASQPHAAFCRSIHNGQVRFIPIDFSKRVSPSTIFRLARIIRENDIQIVHGQGARADFCGRIAKGVSGKAFYVSTVQMPVEGFEVSPLRRLIYRFFDRLSERFVDRFVVVSDALMDQMTSNHRIPAGKVTKIYNGIEVEHFSPKGDEMDRLKIREALHIDEEAMLIGAVGRLVWQKGFEFLIRSVPEILMVSPNAKILLIGDGPLGPKLKSMCESMKLQGKVLFAGFRRDIRSLLSTMDIVVIPSIKEGFPMITLEAMAMARPIVATRIDGIVEQIDDGLNGILVPPEEVDALSSAIIRLLKDNYLARKMGEAAREKVVSRFSIDEMVSKTEGVYMDLLNQAPRGGN
ncbi:MAG: glycosyltransferase [Deltaproteobacteria bacterium]|nr:glycosyltransferase [Deltaproteobacteria bacterium]